MLKKCYNLVTKLRKCHKNVIKCKKGLKTGKKYNLKEISVLTYHRKICHNKK